MNTSFDISPGYTPARLSQILVCQVCGARVQYSVREIVTLSKVELSFDVDFEQFAKFHAICQKAKKQDEY